MSKKNQKEIATHRRYIRIQGRLIGKSFLRRTDADRWFMEMKREKELVESGTKVAPPKLVALAEYAERWMQTRKAQGKPQSSWQTDERRLRLHILPLMGPRPLQQITRREWEEHLDRLMTKKALSPTTRNRVQALLSKLYNDALRQEIVTANPLTMIPKLHESQDAWDYWHTKVETSRYLVAAKEEGAVFRIFTMLALNTGARVGEILALRHEDVQLERRTIHIWRTYEQASKTIVERTKAKSARWLGINEALFEALKEYQRVTPYRRPNDLLIYRQDGNEVNPMPEWMVRNRHKRVCKRSDLKHIRVHDLRHTYASHYMMSGGSLSDLQSLLGHSSPEMTRKYAHLVPGHLESKSKVVSFAELPSSVESSWQESTRTINNNVVQLRSDHDCKNQMTR